MTPEISILIQSPNGDWLWKVWLSIFIVIDRFATAPILDVMSLSNMDLNNVSFTVITDKELNLEGDFVEAFISKGDGLGASLKII